MPLLNSVDKEIYTRHRVSGKKPIDAIRVAKPHLTKGSAYTMANRYEHDHLVKDRFKELLNKVKGMNPDDLLKSVLDDVEATKDVVYNNKGDKTEIKDNDLRWKAKTSLLSMYGVKGFTKDNITMNDNRSITVVNDSPEHLDKLAKVAEVLDRVTSRMLDTSDEQSGKITEIPAD